MYGNDAGNNGAARPRRPTAAPIAVRHVGRRSSRATGARDARHARPDQHRDEHQRPATTLLRLRLHPLDRAVPRAAPTATSTAPTAYVGRTHEILLRRPGRRPRASGSSTSRRRTATCSTALATPGRPPRSRRCTTRRSPATSAPTSRPPTAATTWQSTADDPAPGPAGPDRHARRDPLHARRPLPPRLQRAGARRHERGGPRQRRITAAVPSGHPLAEYANFRYNGNIFELNGIAGTAARRLQPDLRRPDLRRSQQQLPVGMDEDYDACDLENWFLAHPERRRPGDRPLVPPAGDHLVDPTDPTDNDWTRTRPRYTDAEQLVATRAMSRILRPRAIDGHSPDLVPRPASPTPTGKITYDVDNDGDGVTDSVWLDLGYPAQRSPEGQLYKPLFAFMVIGLNGRLPLNTAGNLQRPRRRHLPDASTTPSTSATRPARSTSSSPSRTPGIRPLPARRHRPLSSRRTTPASSTAVDDSPRSPSA